MAQNCMVPFCTMMKEYLVLATVLASAAVWADVKSASADMAVDGRLDEPCWKAADWNGGFQEVAGRKRGGEADLTSFAIVADARAVYLGVRCKEPELAKIKALPADNIWNCDGFEIFLAPTGKSFSFYHFVVPQNPINGTATIFASEGGNIHPDPYGAPWKVARTEGTDEWTAEIEIPFASFYMTRNEEWSTTWLVNIARTRRAKDYQWTTWSPLEKGFLEPERFRAVKGFPKRTAADDVAMTDVTSEIAARSDGRLTGRLRVKAFALVPGDYTLGCSSGTTAKVSLKTGWNKVSVPCAYPANGRYRTELTLTRDATGAAYSRTFPVLVDFDEIRVKLTTPQYRDNFYPGQDSSKIVGSVKTAGAGAVKLTLEGPGIPRVEKTLAAAGDFAFETPGFDFGTATLTVDFGGVTKRVPIRKLAKTGRQMSWIENGHLVVDGKPVFRRNLYGWRYMAGRAFDARIDADKDLFLTPEIVQGSSLEPFRVIKDLEMREAKRDIVPCKEYFEKVTRMIESQKDRDFTCWYISDEPECRGVSPIYLRHIYEFMKKNDPYHVILTSSRAGLTYVDCADWFETHPYPNPSTDAKGERRYGTPINVVGSFVDAYEPEKHPDKCVGTVPQLFSYKFQSLSNEYPTFDEYNSHVWAGLLRGAKSINPFIYTDMGDRPALYEGNRFVFSSIARLEDLLLDAKRTTLLKTDEAECVRWDLPSGDGMFAVVNFTGAEKTVAIKGLDGDYKPFRSKLKGFGRVAPNGQDARSPGVEVELKPFGVVIGTRKTRDAGLPTYDETVALVARQEYERSHRDNQFLEKYDELAGHWTSSFKLIDGVRDVRAWGNRWAKSHDFDFAFLDRPIRFSKVRLYGTEVAAVKVSVRRNGEWQPLTPKSERREGLMTELDFGETLKTVKLRVTAVHAAPNKTDMEIYEIEVPHVAGDDAATDEVWLDEPGLWERLSSRRGSRLFG